MGLALRVDDQGIIPGTGETIITGFAFRPPKADTMNGEIDKAGDDKPLGNPEPFFVAGLVADFFRQSPFFPGAV